MKTPPYQGRGKVALLFVDGERGAERQRAIAAFEGLRWPADCETEVVDIGDRADVAAWFGIDVTPAVVIVRDGVLLAIEYECNADACARAVRAAAPRARRVDVGV